MKTKNNRVPKAPRIPKPTLLDNIRELLKHGGGVCEKRVEQKDGMFVAYNEAGQAVAYFNPTFALELSSYTPKIQDALMPPPVAFSVLPPPDNGKIKLQTPPVMMVKIYREDEPPAFEHRTIHGVDFLDGPVTGYVKVDPSGVWRRVFVVVARDFEQFRLFARRDSLARSNAAARQQIRYVYVTQENQLRGYRWGRGAVLIRLHGWYENRTEEFRKAVEGSMYEAREAFRNRHKIS